MRVTTTIKWLVLLSEMGKKKSDNKCLHRSQITTYVSQNHKFFDLQKNMCQTIFLHRSSYFPRPVSMFPFIIYVIYILAQALYIMVNMSVYILTVEDVRS